MASAALRSPSTGHLPSLPRLLPFLPVPPSPILTQPFLLFLSSASPIHSLTSYSSIPHVSLFPNNNALAFPFIYLSFLGVVKRKLQHFTITLSSVSPPLSFLYYCSFLPFQFPRHHFLNYYFLYPSTTALCAFLSKFMLFLISSSYNLHYLFLTKFYYGVIC